MPGPASLPAFLDAHPRLVVLTLEVDADGATVLAEAAAAAGC